MALIQYCSISLLLSFFDSYEDNCCRAGFVKVMEIVWGRLRAIAALSDIATLLRRAMRY
jgi:hypothetical protein